MCSNSGRPEGWYTATEALLQRLDFVYGQGIRRVILTGGEPTIHRGFWPVVEKIGELAMAWDINTHGRSFADPAFAERAMASGLERAIVSLHSHLPATSCLVSGFEPRHHEQTIHGIDHLMAGGAEVMLNCVICRPNLDHLQAYLAWCVERWGADLSLKFAFPTTIGRGGEWEAIHLRYDEVQDTIRALHEAGGQGGVKVIFESVPNCVLGDADAADLSRSGFGETHYLDDISGDKLYPIRYIEAQLSVFGAQCRDCAALTRCPGVAEDYARRHGVAELVPMACTPAT